MIIFFYKRLTRSRNRKLVFLQVRDTKFGSDFCNEMSLNAAKSHGYSFYRFWVIKGKPTGGGVKIILHPD